MTEQERNVAEEKLDQETETEEQDVQPEPETVPVPEEVEETDKPASAGETEPAKPVVQPVADAPMPAVAEVAVVKPDMKDTIIVAFTTLILGLLFVFGCQQLTNGGNAQAAPAPKGEIAATVGDVQFGEEDVASEVYRVRYFEEQIWDDKEWAQWLADSGFTDTAQVREAILNSKVQAEILRQAFEENGIEVTDEEIDAEFESGAAESGGKEKFLEELQAYGIDEETYREQIRSGLKQEKLIDKVTSGNNIKTATDEEVLETIKTYFAEQVDEKAKSLDDVDQELVDYVRQSMDSSAKYEAFDAWLEDYKASKGVTINPAPENLPYGVDMSGVEMQKSFDLNDLLSSGAVEGDDASSDSGSSIEIVDDGEATEDDAAATEKEPEITIDK